MIEVTGIDGGIEKHDVDGHYTVDDKGVLWIYSALDDRGRSRVVAVHASGTWSMATQIIEKVTV